MPSGGVRALIYMRQEAHARALDDTALLYRNVNVVLVCVCTQCVQSVATRVVAKIYRPIFILFLFFFVVREG